MPESPTPTLVGRFFAQLLINALTGKVGTGTNMSGYPTNRELSTRFTETQLESAPT